MTSLTTEWAIKRLLLALSLSVLLLPAATQAASEWDVYPPTGLQPFLGLDDTSAPTRVQQGRAQTLQNVSIGLSADLRKRAGIDMIGETLDKPGEELCAVTGLTFAQFAGSNSRIIAICGRQPYYLSGSDWIEINPQPPEITAGQNNQFVFAPALDQLVSTNDVNPPFQWGGGASDTWNFVSFSGLASTNVIQTARTATFYRNFLIFGNTKENNLQKSTRVRWSNVGTIDTWTDKDFVDVDAPAGQELNCMAQLFGDVYLGFTHSIYRMSLVGGSQTFAFTRVSDEIGCVAKNSVQQVTLGNTQLVLLFLDARKRLYAFNGTVAVEVSSRIHSTMNAANGQGLERAVSASDDEHYWISLRGGGASTNTLTLEFNYLLQEWSKYTGVVANAMARIVDSNSNSRIYFGTGDSYVYQLNDTTLDNDVAGASGVVDTLDRIDSSHASSRQILYDASQAYTASAFIGAPIALVGGAASGEVNVVIENTTTGLVMGRDFTATPDATTSFLVGQIDAFYTTRWDDFGEPSRIKHAGEMFLVADADVGSTLAIGYAVNFQSNSAEPTASLTPAEGSLWGTGTWGTSVWGGGDIVFRRIDLEDDGRWWRFTFTEDDLDQNFRLHGWQILYEKGGHL